MTDNKKDHSDFYDPYDSNKRFDSGSEAKDEGGERSSYSYFYGSSKPASYDQEPDKRTTVSSSEGTSYVDVTAPRPVKPAAYDSEGPNQPGLGSWRVNEPRKGSSFKGLFAAFMAGVLVIGTLMFASDKMNLFTGSNAASGVGGGGSLPTAGSSSGLKGAALDVGRPSNIAEIVQQVSPAVVKIDTFVQAKSRRSNSIYDDPFFRHFFGDESPQQQQPKNDQKQEAGLGTGFIFEKSGYILTNQHVIDGADEIEVTVQGYDKPFKAQLLGNDFNLDLAVLKIDNDKDFPTLPIGDSNSMNIGDWVVAIGNPYGFDHTVTVGVLSARERKISIPEQQGTRNYEHLLQTDASINPGNSGGPLINANGEVIGINTAVNAQAQGMGFAIPTTTISGVLDKLKNNVKIPLPYIGASLINLKDIEKSTLTELKIEGSDGALVEDVLLGSPAFKAGLKKYDVITGIDGTALKTKEELIQKIQTKKPGDKATFGVIRDGKKLDLEIVIGDKNEYMQKQQNQQNQQQR